MRSGALTQSRLAWAIYAAFFWLLHYVEFGNQVAGPVTVFANSEVDWHATRAAQI